ncbi:MAG: HNH endonuclease [Syntrophobacteraceae bacterium]
MAKSLRKRAKLIFLNPRCGATPSDWIWHHANETGVMQLVPEAQHTPGSAYWSTLHPSGRGGYSIWAIPAGAPPN